MPKDAKGLAVILMGKAKPKAKDDGMDEGLLVASEEAMQAVKDGDADAFARALKSFVSMCGDYDGEE